MNTQSRILYRTNYFQREWTWIRRGLYMIGLGIGIFVVPLDSDLQFLKFIVTALMTFYFIAKPKDDVAVTDKLFVHIQRSVIPRFTRIDKYAIEELVSIRCGGIHSDGWELVDFFNGAGRNAGSQNTVEMTFRNGDSKSLLLPIDRKKLDTVVKIIYDIKRREPNRVPDEKIAT